MKKQHFIHFLVVAAIATLAVGCQKEEQSTVTLGAKIQKPVSGDSKVYIDDHTPCWHNGDMVYINDAAYPVMAATSASARIENVTASSAYRALFPASLVTPGIDISSSSSIPVTLPSVQRYELIGSHQRVDVPMGAYLTNGSTLHFFNLCSIVRVTVSNALNQELPLRHIVLEAANARLSGEGTATVSGDSTNHIVMSSTARHAACLGFTADCPVTVPARGSKTFDIVVPAFARDNVTFTVYTTDNHYFETIKNNVSLWRNCITTVTLNVNSLTQITAAELVDGPTFNAAIPDNATAVVFEYNNNSVTTGTLLSTPDSPTRIYGNLEGTTWRVSTAAHMINANWNCKDMFKGHWDNDFGRYLSRLETIIFGEGFNTSNVSDMSNMFDGCSGLTSLDVSHFNTDNVTNMRNIFNECNGLTSLDISNFNTSNVTDMGSMFHGCNSLTSLDVSHFNTSNVTIMSAMFGECSSLTNLNLSNFSTSNVTDMDGIFSGCCGLSSLNVSNFNTSNVTNMSAMFARCSSLTNLNLSNFSTSNATSMSAMFAECSSLTNLNLSNFNTSNVTNMGSMFHGCNSLTSLDVSHFNTSNVTIMSAMFAGCSSLTNLNLSNFSTSNATSMSAMFYECRSLMSLDLSNFNTSRVNDMYLMFGSCDNLTSLNLASFNTSNVTNMSYMFNGCGGLTSLNLSNFNTSNVTNMDYMFHFCAGLTNLNISNFNTTSVTTMTGMFSECINLTSLNLSSFTTSNVTMMVYMFHRCVSLTSLDLSNFDMSHLGYYDVDNNWRTGKDGMCMYLSTYSGGQCTITCPTAVRTALENGTDLPTSGVVFTWVTPTSK